MSLSIKQFPLLIDSTVLHERDMDCNYIKRSNCSIYCCMYHITKLAVGTKFSFIISSQMDNSVLRIDRMDPALYEAVMDGNTKEYEALPQIGSHLQLTPKGNTILHVAALHGHTHLVQNILEKHTYAASLLRTQNKKQETALHIAASEGHADIVSALINYAKTTTCPDLIESGIKVGDIVRMRDGDKDTALHKAARKGHLEVVKLLVKEDSNFQFLANEAGETPLYLAAELQFYECFSEIFENCDKPVYGGPYGRNALHAAIIKFEQPEPSDCTKLLLEQEASLCEMGDDRGWTPLHYAVKQNSESVVADILRVRSSAAYIPASKEGKWTTAVHIAASKGSIGMLGEILKHCPDCWEMVDSEGQNVLHSAILSGKTEMVKFILNSPKTDHLIDEKDNDGNTPLHLLAACDMYIPQLVKHPRLKDTVAFNKQHLSPLDIARHTSSEDLCSGLRKACNLGKRYGDRNGCSIIKTGMKKKEESERGDQRHIDCVMKAVKSGPVVATLLATVTFAAGITLPGGYENNTRGVGGKETEAGMAVLLKNAAFKAFVIADAIGFVCSIVSMIGYMQFQREAVYYKSPKAALWIWNYAGTMLNLSLIAVIIAFVTGLFAVLARPTPLTAALCVFICLFASCLVHSPRLMGNMKHRLRRLIEHRFLIVIRSIRNKDV